MSQPSTTPYLGTTSTSEAPAEWSTTWTSANGFSYRFAFDLTSLSSSPANPGLVTPSIGLVSIENTHTDRPAPLGSENTGNTGAFAVALMYQSANSCSTADEATFGDERWCWLPIQLANPPVELDAGETVRLKHRSPNAIDEDQWEEALGNRDSMRVAVLATGLQFGGRRYDLVNDTDGATLCPTEHRTQSGYWIVALTDAHGGTLDPIEQRFAQSGVGCDSSRLPAEVDENGVTIVWINNQSRGNSLRVFNPTETTVPLGGTVQFNNNTGTPCELTSDDLPVPEDYAVGLDPEPILVTVPPYDSRQVTFTEPTDMDLHCTTDAFSNIAGGTVVTK